MQSLSELKTSLAEYRAQLATVEAHLGGSEIQGDERGELEQMKTDLVEVIALTEDLVREATPPAAQASPGTLPERGEGSGDPATAPSTSSQAGAEVKAKSTSSVPGPVQEQIRRNQARAALTGKVPLHWAVGHRCEAYRLGKGGVAEEGEWSEAHVRSCTADGNVVVEFQRDRHMQEATVAMLRPRKEIATEEKYVPVAAPKLAKVGGDDGENQGKSNVPQKLVIRETDDERTRTQKRKILKAMKKKERFIEMDRAQQNKKSSWQSFNAAKGSKKKKGFFTGRKKESIFKTSAQGRVGVTGSGKTATKTQPQRKRHEFVPVEED